MIAFDVKSDEQLGVPGMCIERYGALALCGILRLEIKSLAMHLDTHFAPGEIRRASPSCQLDNISQIKAISHYAYTSATFLKEA